MKRPYIYKKVKGLATALVLAPLSASLFSGCSDFLDIKPQTEIIHEEFWQEKSDVDAIVAGLYAALEADPLVRRMIVWGEGRTENVMAGSDIDKDVNLNNIFKESITAKNSYCTWDGFYNIINRCNIILKYAPEVAHRDPGYTQSELKATEAEVIAIRSLCYFYLIRTFRDVPYTTEAYIDDSQKMDLPATPFATVLDNLIADLERVKGNAIARYSTNKPAYQTGRITRDAIYAMLCEMYLWQGNYQQSCYYADLVIASKTQFKKEQDSKSTTASSESADQFGGFPLVSNVSASNTYGKAYNDIFVDGNSVETIFELVYDNTEAGHSMLSNSAAGQLYGNGVLPGRMAPANIVVNDIESESTDAYKIFSKENGKKDARMVQNAGFVIGSQVNITKFVMKDVIIDGSGAKLSATGTAYNYAKKNNVEYWYTSSNWIIYRITDIMLLKAEALCQLTRTGDDADTKKYNDSILTAAFDLVQAVNDRALCEAVPTSRLAKANYNTKEKMETLVLQERHRELMFEGKRWYDLVRRSLRDNNTSVLQEAMLNREGPNAQLAKAFFSDKANANWKWAIFWPYFYEETLVNKNLKANPAYSDGNDSSIK